MTAPWQVLVVGFSGEEHDSYLDARSAEIDHRAGTYTTPKSGASPATTGSLRSVTIVRDATTNGGGEQ